MKRITGRARRLMRAARGRARMAYGVQAVSDCYGLDRGQPILRYYMDLFLREFAADIHGHCLEFQDPSYAPSFGGAAVTKLDILHIDDSNKHATLVADLTKPNMIPDNLFDCIICTYVLHVIFDLDKAIADLYRILKPGGVLLVGVPHVSMCDIEWHELWRFTGEGLHRVLGKAFGMENVTVRVYGNSLTAAAQMRGLAAEEFTQKELNHHDPRFAVQICARAEKKSASAMAADGLRSALGEPQRIAQGWDQYAQEWDPHKVPILAGHQAEYLGDEWTLEDESRTGGNVYGLPLEVLHNFNDYLRTRLLDPYLPAGQGEGLEIGPGGGRVTALLIPRTRVLHVVDGSATMLKLLQRRFADVTSLRYHHSDGMTLPVLSPESLDYVFSFDVFVHFEPRLIYWYLQQVVRLLKPGATGIIHYANTLTPIGWESFKSDLVANVKGRMYFGSFGVMCPQLMEQFLKALAVEIVTLDLGLIPRDAIAVFRKKG